ncbi:MAG: DUF2116 family Zn-ribbon domain-containing protein [Bacteroidales bacterium]|nr:DUF2116 family Zn-ribbon domain-containing protein [Bacteroidales bacterium]
MKDTVTPVDTVTCLNCGEPFTPRRKTARFCSDKCRVKYSRKRNVFQNL